MYWEGYIFETGSLYVDGAGLELSAILLPQLLQCWENRYGPPHTASINVCAHMCRICHLCAHMWLMSASAFLHLVLWHRSLVDPEAPLSLDLLAHEPQGSACLYISTLTSPSNHLPSPAIINKL